MTAPKLDYDEDVVRENSVHVLYYCITDSFYVVVRDPDNNVIKSIAIEDGILKGGEKQAEEIALNCVKTYFAPGFVSETIICEDS